MADGLVPSENMTTPRLAALFFVAIAISVALPSASASLLDLPLPTCNALGTACVGASVGWCNSYPDEGKDCLDMTGSHSFSVLAVNGVGDLSSVFHDTRFNNVCVVNGAGECLTNIHHDLGTGVPECAAATATSTPMIGDSVQENADNFDSCAAYVVELLLGDN